MQTVFSFVESCIRQILQYLGCFFTHDGGLLTSGSEHLKITSCILFHPEKLDRSILKYSFIWRFKTLFGTSLMMEFNKMLNDVCGLFRTSEWTLMPYLFLVLL